MSPIFFKFKLISLSGLLQTLSDSAGKFACKELQPLYGVAKENTENGRLYICWLVLWTGTI
jgi:hypothetical protein